jgi:hypothetical protein
MADIDDAMKSDRGETSPVPEAAMAPSTEQGIHTLHFGYASSTSGWDRIKGEDTGSWPSILLDSIANVARQGAVDGDPPELLRFIGSLGGRVVAIRYEELGGRPTGGGATLRRGSFDTYVVATMAPRRCIGASALLGRRRAELARAQAIARLSALDAGVRRELLAQVTIAVFGKIGTVWLHGVSVREQFDVCLSAFPWSFMETVEMVSHPGLEPAAPSVLGRLVVHQDRIGSDEQPSWLEAYVERIDAAITSAPAEFAQRLDWLDDAVKFRDPKGYIQVVTAWFGVHKDAQECQDRIALVLRQHKVPVEIRRSACERLVERMGNNQDPTLLAAIAAAGKRWREQDTGTNLPDDLLGMLAERLRHGGFGGESSVFASQPLEVLDVLADASSHGLHGDGGGSLLRLLSDVIESGQSVAGGGVEDWVARLQKAIKQRMHLPATCGRLVARIWREYALADREEDKKRLKQLLALRKELARLDSDLRIGEVDLKVVRTETDGAMVQAFQICSGVLGRGWLARALLVHAEAADELGQPVEPAVRKAVGNAERLGDPYKRDFFQSLFREFADAKLAALRAVVLRQVWLRLRNLQGSHKTAARLAIAARKARLGGELVRLERELPLAPRPPSRLWPSLFWLGMLALVLAISAGITYLLAPDFVLDHGRVALQWAADLWKNACMFIDGLKEQGEPK